MAITRPRSVVRDSARYVLAFRPQRPDAEEAIWTPEEQADYEQWLRDFSKPIDDAERDIWLDLMDAEITWGRPVPSC